MQETDDSNFKDKETNSDLEVIEKLSLLEWLANSYKKFGCTLEFVTNKSQEGSQFCRGFGGIGGLLRYVSHPVSNFSSLPGATFLDTSHTSSN